ncbi:LIM domain protein [Oesophagostomum dentatum]|uniref:LIM domain protein n=1 Tax=Oesophagostomum dentatum TaxID=61180 RepID=A0A0B1RTA8_OESDE|nr:LIM domain protein [Oesophagostomum dentatum]
MSSIAARRQYSNLIFPFPACHLPLRETCLTALKKKYHHECFRCCRCRGAMPNGQYYLWNGSPFCEDCYYALRCVRRSSNGMYQY